MKLITLFVGERLDHVLDFDDMTQGTETFIIEKQDSTQLFAFYHALGEVNPNCKGAIFQTDEEEKYVFVNSIEKLQEKDKDNDIEITVKLSGEESFKEINDKELSFNNKEELNLWPLELKTDTINDSCKVKVHFDLNFDGKKYSKELILCVAHKKNIFDVVIDFGSEASQMAFINRNDAQRTRGILELFDEMKMILPPISGEKANKNSEYLQYDELDKHLFKSIFFSPREIKSNISPVHHTNTDARDENQLKMLTTLEEAKSLTTKKGHIQLPNIKIAQFGGLILPRITIDNDGDPYEYLYRNGINELVFNALKKVKENQCVIIHVLMPNVYSPTDVVNHLQELRKDINETLKINKLSVKAIELSSISESDASMLGAKDINDVYYNVKLTEGTYIIIDAGKGTLDFSALRLQIENDKLKAYSIYRDGIIGAGNSLTYAYLYALLFDFLSTFKNDIKDEDLRKYIFENVLGCTDNGRKNNGGDLAEILKLMKAVENYKIIDGDPYKAADNLEYECHNNNKVSIFDLKIETLTENIKNKVAGKKPLSDKARLYISNAIDQIVEEVVNRLGHLKKMDNNNQIVANGIFFSGRAFCLSEFKKKMMDKLVENKIVESGSEINYTSRNDQWNVSQKNVCLYVRNAIKEGLYNSRMSSIPQKIQSKIIGKTTDNKTNRWESFKKHCNQIILLFIQKISKNPASIFKKLASKIKDFVNDRGSKNEYQKPGDIENNWLVGGHKETFEYQNESLMIGNTMYKIDTLQNEVTLFFTGNKFKYRFPKNDKFHTSELEPNGLDLRSSFFFFGTLFPYVKPEKWEDVTLPYKDNQNSSTETPEEAGTNKGLKHTETYLKLKEINRLIQS